MLSCVLDEARRYTVLIHVYSNMPISLNKPCEDEFWTMCFPVFEKKMKLLEKGKATLQGLADAQALAFLETVAEADRKAV